MFIVNQHKHHMLTYNATLPSGWDLFCSNCKFHLKLLTMNREHHMFFNIFTSSFWFKMKQSLCESTSVSLCRIHFKAFTVVRKKKNTCWDSPVEDIDTEMIIFKSWFGVMWDGQFVMPRNRRTDAYICFISPVRHLLNGTFWHIILV